MKILCVLLPHFPLRCETLRHPEIKYTQAALTLASDSQKLILDYSPDLVHLERGMPLAQALSFYGDLTVIHADAPYYQAVFNEVLDALETRSPVVEGLSLGEIYIGMDGLQSIYGSDDTLARAIRDVIPAIFKARLGIAYGKFPAYLAAIQCPDSDDFRVLPEPLSSFVKDLSCDLLPVSLKTRSRLHEFGLHTLGQIAAIAVGPLQAQFGPEGRRIRDLARGRDETPLYPRTIEETIEESTALPSVTVSLDILLMAWEAMLARCFSELESRGLGLSRLNLWTLSLVGEHWEKDINLREPTLNPKVALSRIRHVLQNCPQPGPVEQLGIKVTGLGKQSGRQKSLLTDVRAQDHLQDEIRQLEFRLGGPQLYSVKEIEPWSRIPERRYALVPLSR